MKSTRLFVPGLRAPAVFFAPLVLASLALAMESPSLPAGTSFGISGGIGYYNEKAAATAAFADRKSVV